MSLRGILCGGHGCLILTEENMGKSKTVVGEKHITGKVRLSFPNLFKPEMGGQFPSKQYKASFLWDKNDKACIEDLKALKIKVLATAKAAFGFAKLSEFAHPFREGNDKPELDGYKDCIFITAKSKYRPGVVNGQMNEITEESDIYGGCYVRASVYPYAYTASETLVDEKGNRKTVIKKGISLRLGNVQKIAEGEAFGGKGTPADADFGAVEGESAETGDETAFEDEDTLGL